MHRVFFIVFFLSPMFVFASEAVEHDICSICQDSLEETSASGESYEACAGVGVSHNFHGRCISGWIHAQQRRQHQPTCPICIHVIEESKVTEIKESFLPPPVSASIKPPLTGKERRQRLIKRAFLRMFVFPVCPFAEFPPDCILY